MKSLNREKALFYLQLLKKPTKPALTGNSFFNDYINVTFSEKFGVDFHGCNRQKIHKRSKNNPLAPFFKGELCGIFPF